MEQLLIPAAFHENSIPEAEGLSGQLSPTINAYFEPIAIDEVADGSHTGKREAACGEGDILATNPEVDGQCLTLASRRIARKTTIRCVSRTLSGPHT